VRGWNALGRSKGGGRAQQGGEGVEEGQRRRARGLAVACSPGGLEGGSGRSERVGGVGSAR